MRRWLALFALLSGLATACAGAVDERVVDGWPIGPALPCAASQRCPELAEAATNGLARRDPGHAAIVSLTLHAEGAVVDASGRRVLQVRSGACCDVALFKLADGNLAAIGVGYPGISETPVAIDYGP
jgi:hypothetical protein